MPDVGPQNGLGGSVNRYDDAVSAMRVGLPARPELRDYVRFGTLASNSHNTQPWKFRLGTDTIDVLPDFARRTPVVDPDDHHLYVTLGCAAQNIVIAANASSRPAELSLTADAGEGTAIHVFLGKGSGTAHSSDADLRGAIPVRQSTRSVYDGQALSGISGRVAARSRQPCRKVRRTRPFQPPPVPNKSARAPCPASRCRGQTPLRCPGSVERCPCSWLAVCH